MAAKSQPRGCEHCTLHDIDGIQIVSSPIKPNKEILLVGQSPGAEENKQGIELVGPAGQWWWQEAEAVGLPRKLWNIANANRCFPADWTHGSYNRYLKMRNPSALEMHCCSVYLEEAIQKAHAKQIVVLGQMAAKQVLKTRSLPTQRTLWSDELQARVYLLDHPAFFVRGYGQGPRLDAFRALLKRVAEDYAVGVTQQSHIDDQFDYIRQQKYQLVVTKKQALAAEEVIREYAAAGERILFDVEWDIFGKERRVFACGFSPRPGMSFVFVWWHRELDPAEGPAVLEVVRRLCEDPAIVKAAHYGCSDVMALAEYEDIHVKGYRRGGHDTNLSEFLRFSDERSYGLSAVAERRFPKFSGYGMLIIPELMTAAKKKLEKAGTKLPKPFNGTVQAQENWVYGAGKDVALHLRHLSLDTLRLYNGADCDLGKRIESGNRKHVPQNLMDLYIDLGFVLSQMETNGPLYDYEQHAKLL